MAITRIGSANAAGTVAKPAGIVAGDVMVAWVRHSGGGTAPSGWSTAISNGDGACYYKVATASEPTTYTFTSTNYVGTEGPPVILAAYRGAKPALAAMSPAPYRPANFVNGSWDVTAPSLTTTEKSMVLTWLRWDATETFAPPNGFATVAVGKYGQEQLAERYYSYSGTVGGGTWRANGGFSNPRVAAVALAEANNPPTAPTWVTPQNTVIPVDADFDLDWDHNDPDPGDTQSEYVLDRWTLDANGARIAGSNVRVTVATPNTYRRITAGSLAVGAYEYKVATRDSQGAPTDPAQLVFSESLFVTAAESPDPPTFVAPGPIAGETISTSSREYVISAPDVDASEWTLYADNNGTIDTSTILAGPVLKETGDLRRHTFTGLANNTAVWAQVEIKDGGLWSQPTQQRNPVAYSPPPAPTYTLLEDPAEGEIVVQINNPAPGTGEVATSYNDVFITDPGKPEQRRATEIPANGAWTYQLPPSGFDGITTGSVRVEAVADNGTRSSSA